MIVGIDPGKKGGLVALDTASGAIVDMCTMPEWPHDILALLEIWLKKDGGIHHVYLEKAQAMPKNGAVSMFNYGVGFGSLVGIVTALSIRMTLIPPTTWTKIMHLGATGKDAKAKTLQIAQRLFPNQKLTDPDAVRAKKPHDGIVDALLIAEFGRRMFRK